MSGVFLHHSALGRALGWAAFGAIGATLGLVVAHVWFGVRASFLAYANVVVGVALLAGVIGALSTYLSNADNPYAGD